MAIKRISGNRSQWMREFITEIASLRHMELRGWSKPGENQLLVYDFMPNSSLDASLFGTGVAPSPVSLSSDSLEQCVRILRASHRGRWEQVVLLGADMSAWLGDFGLARLARTLPRCRLAGLGGSNWQANAG
jgi:hypothetical protein